MTPERANEVIEIAKRDAKGGPWSDQLEKLMTKEERSYVKSVWDNMNGSTAFVDALYRVARGQVVPRDTQEEKAQKFVKDHFVFLHIGD